MDVTGLGCCAAPSAEPPWLPLRSISSHDLETTPADGRCSFRTDSATRLPDARIAAFRERRRSRPTHAAGREMSPLRYSGPTRRARLHSSQSAPSGRAARHYSCCANAEAAGICRVVGVEQTMVWRCMHALETTPSETASATVASFVDQAARRGDLVHCWLCRVSRAHCCAGLPSEPRRAAFTAPPQASR
jgi:hypothetical protein